MRMGWRIGLLPLLCLSLGMGASAQQMNQIQTLASHNSYKKRIDPALYKLMVEGRGGQRMQGLDYGHLSLTEQLDLGLRGLEIDVVNDPDGRFAHPLGIKLLADRNLPAGAEYDPEHVMSKPGLKVMHIPDIDFRSHAYTFRQALGILKTWSDAHPRHLPIMITMNAKTDNIKEPGATPLLPFDAKAFDGWDTEIRESLPSNKLITPDMVRGQYPTLEQAVLAHAWPTLEASRGRFFFLLDEKGEKQATYLAGHPSLRGRMMFVDAPEGRPEAALRIVNEPKENLAYIQYLVRSGYWVRTRADADTLEARKGDYSRWKAALESGAQTVSTDYYREDPAFGTHYEVHLPGGGPGLWNNLLLPPVRPLPPLE